MTSETAHLLARLRENCSCIHEANEPCDHTCDRCVAAAEIERLTRELAQARADVAHAAEEHADLLKRWGAVVDERDRLRGALAFYAERSNWKDEFDYIPYSVADRDEGCRARMALSGERSSGETRER